MPRFNITHFTVEFCRNNYGRNSFYDTNPRAQFYKTFFACKLVRVFVRLGLKACQGQTL